MLVSIRYIMKKMSVTRANLGRLSPPQPTWEAGGKDGVEKKPMSVVSCKIWCCHKETFFLEKY